MLYPNQFQVNEAWIAFTLNDTPIQTEQDGAFNCLCLMDAASCYMLANDMVPITAKPSPLQVRRLLKMAQSHTDKTPSTLFVPTGQFDNDVTGDMQHQGIKVVSVAEEQLLAFIGEAKQGFREHVLNERRE